jgi:hypothetical protein
LSNLPFLILFNTYDHFYNLYLTKFINIHYPHIDSLKIVYSYNNITYSFVHTKEDSPLLELFTTDGIS